MQTVPASCPDANRFRICAEPALNVSPLRCRAAGLISCRDGAAHSWDRVVRDHIAVTICAYEAVAAGISRRIGRGWTAMRPTYAQQHLLRRPGANGPTPCGPCGRDSPAPSIAARPRPANRGRPAFSVPGRQAARFRDVLDVGTTTNPKANIVVAVVGPVVVAVGRATVGRIVVPSAAAQHAGQVSGNPAGPCLPGQYARRHVRVQIKSCAPLRGAQ